MAFLEERFKVKVEDQEVIPENLDSIDKLSRYLEKKLQGGGGSVAG